MTSARLLPALVAASTLTFVGACSASANYTVPAGDIADTAANTLADQIGTDTLPAVDCGDGDIDIVNGTKVDCTLTDAGDDYATTLTVFEVHGKKYKLHVKVASEPN